MVDRIPLYFYILMLIKDFGNFYVEKVLGILFRKGLDPYCKTHDKGQTFLHLSAKFNNFKT